MNDLSCMLDTLVTHEERRVRPKRLDNDLNDALKAAIDATCVRIDAAFAGQPKVVAKLRH